MANPMVEKWLQMLKKSFHAEDGALTDLAPGRAMLQHPAVRGIIQDYYFHLSKAGTPEHGAANILSLPEIYDLLRHKLSPEERQELSDNYGVVLTDDDV